MAYKLTTGAMRSCVLDNRPGITVQYKLKQRVVSHSGCGPMAVFDTLAHAIAFSPDLEFRVFRCRIKKSKCPTMFYKDRHFNSSDRAGFPKGTILADAVTLLEEMTIE